VTDLKTVEEEKFRLHSVFDALFLVFAGVKPAVLEFKGPFEI
jgi:hypothetical protein